MLREFAKAEASKDLAGYTVIGHESLARAHEMQAWGGGWCIMGAGNRYVSGNSASPDTGKPSI